jgi:hypothetical protein
VQIAVIEVTKISVLDRTGSYRGYIYQIYLVIGSFPLQLDQMASTEEVAPWQPFYDEALDKELPHLPGRWDFSETKELNINSM